MELLGLLSIVIAWLGLIVLITFWKGNASMTFSQHAAISSASVWYYFVLWLICLPLFYLFMTRSFIPEFGFGFWFQLYLVGAIAGWAMAAIVPETKGWKVRVHRFSAFAMCYFVALMTLYIAFSGRVALPARVVATLSIVVMFGEIVYLNFHNRRHRHMLVLQALYFAVFHLTILTSWYLR